MVMRSWTFILDGDADPVLEYYGGVKLMGQTNTLLPGFAPTKTMSRFAAILAISIVLLVALPATFVCWKTPFNGSPTALEGDRKGHATAEHHSAPNDEADGQVSTTSTEEFDLLRFADQTVVKVLREKALEYLQTEQTKAMTETMKALIRDSRTKAYILPVAFFAAFIGLVAVYYTMPGTITSLVDWFKQHLAVLNDHLASLHLFDDDYEGDVTPYGMRVREIGRFFKCEESGDFLEAQKQEKLASK